MTLDQDWTDNSNGDLLQFNYFPAGGWDDPQLASAQADIAALIVHVGDAAGAPGWLRLIQRMPAALLAALAAELRAGNAVTAVASTGWPEPGSVVVSLRRRFTVARVSPASGVLWRELNDPHYAREEVMQQQAGTSYLLIH